MAQQIISNKGVIFNSENWEITAKDRIFLKVADTISEMSTCCSFQVGCVIVNDNRIISMGYNGVPSGAIHCDTIFRDDKNTMKPEEFRKIHHAWSNNNEIHAEMNAILYAAKKGIAIDRSTIYCTLMPCNHCLKAICNSGIDKIFYSDIYDKTYFNYEIVDTLRQSKIKLIFCGDEENV